MKKSDHIPIKPDANQLERMASGIANAIRNLPEDASKEPFADELFDEVNRRVEQAKEIIAAGQFWLREMEKDCRQARSDQSTVESGRGEIQGEAAKSEFDQAVNAARANVHQTNQTVANYSRVLDNLRKAITSGNRATNRFKSEHSAIDGKGKMATDLIEGRTVRKPRSIGNPKL